MTTRTDLTMPTSAGKTDRPALPPAVSGERHEWMTPVGRLSYYFAAPDKPTAKARPLLLIHSINAAASAAEVRPLYEHYRHERPVFAIDLPGYGFSDRSDRIYTPRLMTDALRAMLDEIERRCGPGPIDALAVSLSSEYLARLAAEAPQRLRRIALVSPTGFNGTRRRDGPPGSTLYKAWLYKLLSWSVWSDGIYRLLTRPGVIRYYLGKTWGSKSIDEVLWQYCIATTRQPGARHAPLYFLCGMLFSNDITRVYESLTQPVWMSHGTRGDFVDYRGERAFQGRANWCFDVFEAGALPYFERPAEFIRRFDAFLAAGVGKP
jgi:pimeloyl-ACP methyl ester carboxylesterase